MFEAKSVNAFIFDLSVKMGIPIIDILIIAREHLEFPKSRRNQNIFFEEVKKIRYIPQ